MARILRLPALRLLVAAMALALVPVGWSLSRRLEQAAVLVARSDDVARTVESAAAALQDSVARSGYAAQDLPSGCCVQLPAEERLGRDADGAVRLPATGGNVVTSGMSTAGPEPSETVRGGGSLAPVLIGELGEHWRAEAEATRQLDALHGLSLRPGLEWLAHSLVGLREASLAQMAAADDALRHPGSRRQGASPAEPGTQAGDKVGVLAGQVRRDAEDHRRDIVAALLAQAARDRQRLTAAVAGTALLSALLLVVVRRRAIPPARREDIPSIREPILSCSSLAGRPEPAGASITHSQPGATTTLRILLVEDNAMVRFSLEMMLSDLGHTVSAAATAAEAMRLADADPQVLVTDLGLPDLDGLTLANRLRVLRPGLRVVVASGRSGIAPAGMVWLQKPFDLDRLRRAVEASDMVAA